MPILKQLSQIAKRENISIRKFEEKISATQGVVSKAIAKNGDIKGHLIERIVEVFPQYSPEWLLTGTGEMLKERKNNVSGDQNMIANDGDNYQKSINTDSFVGDMNNGDQYFRQKNKLKNKEVEFLSERINIQKQQLKEKDELINELKDIISTQKENMELLKLAFGK